jgi:ATP/maltotriose-dependent transcriptional regulator MalT/DNA-binding SARP family transcriptional activator
MNNQERDSPQGSPARTSPSIIRTKISQPLLGANVVERPRLNELIQETIRGSQILVVAATAGSGKTTAVVQACQSGTTPVAWLTLDRADSAPGRLLLYLEAALETQVASVRGLVNEVLASRLPHDEAAGLLVDATNGVPLILVIDGLEHLIESPGALAVIEALVRYAPISLKVMLLSRSDIPIDSRMMSGVDLVASVGERELAFTHDEAATVLQKMEMADVDTSHAMEVTNGWVAGVLFESWRSRKNIVGVGGEADPLHGYLSSQILERLEPDEREFLIGTSLLDEVTPRRAAALGEVHTIRLLMSLRTKHLPVSWADGNDGMLCHPRFREYLMALFDRKEPDEVATRRSVYGDLLLSEGHLEEAVEQYILAGDLKKAHVPAEQVLGGIIDRFDFAVADRWLGALVGAFGEQDLSLALPQLLLAISREDYGLACAISDSLAEAKKRDQFASTSALGASMMAWAYWHLNRIPDMESVMANAPRSPEMGAIRYLMTLVNEDYVAEFEKGINLTGGPLDALVMRVHFAHGRLKEMAQEPESLWAVAVSSPWRIGLLRASGRLTQALDVYAQSDNHSHSLCWLHGIVGPELMIDLQRVDETLNTLTIGRQHIKASGSVLFEWLSILVEVKCELRLRRKTERALTLLDQVDEASDRRYHFINEAVDMWRGLANLLEGGQDDLALVSLQRAVHSMVGAQRIIELPAAAVYLAEAEWRAGNSDGADSATDLALSASQQQGSHHQLLLALADFEAVLARRLDIETDTDSEWHELGRSLIGRHSVQENQNHVSVLLHEFGETALEVEGEIVKPRIAKSLALVALLATAPNHSVTRSEALNALFDGELNDSSRAYLRQTVHRLREVMPAGVGPSFVGEVLSFSGTVSMSSESIQCENFLNEANRLQGDEKLELLERALALLEKGEYLPKIESSWADDRRLLLLEKTVNASLSGAAICFEAQRYQQAKSLAESSLVRDPFSERAWRMVMRVSDAIGDADAVTAAYRRCETTLAEGGLVPSAATRDLFQLLRPS